MATERLADPILGEGEIFFPGKEKAWATFKKEFPPTNSRVLVLASVVKGSVPQAQRDLYRAGLVCPHRRGLPRQMVRLGGLRKRT
jgi:hypothetical protein